MINQILWCILPSSNLAKDLVVSNCSKDIFIIAVTGAARKTPVTPHSIPQKISDTIIVTGCNLKAEPITLGSIKSPTIILIIVGIKIIKIIGVGVVYWINATGIGKARAINAPNTGMKVKKKVLVIIKLE